MPMPNSGISGSEIAAQPSNSEANSRMIPVVHHEEHEGLAEYVHRDLHQYSIST